MATLAALEPHSLKSCFLAAENAILAREQRQRRLELFLRCFQEAQRQRSDYYTLLAATGAVLNAVVLSCSSATAQEVVTAFQQAEPALRRCKRLLPQRWVAGLEVSVSNAQQGCIILQAQLQQPGSSRAVVVAAASAAARARARLVQEADSPDDRVDRLLYCSGCGKAAVGLRRCSACHSARYCRWVGVPAFYCICDGGKEARRVLWMGVCIRQIKGCRLRVRRIKAGEGCQPWRCSPQTSIRLCNLLHVCYMSPLHAPLPACSTECQRQHWRVH